jgi:uncharacterized protein with beta-barrel porin domain
LSKYLPAIGKHSSSLTILGYGVTIDGSNSGEPLPVFAVGQGSVTISDFIIQNASSRGGAGGSGFAGGGGGTGGGGALYVHSGSVMTISALTLNNNQAIGGAGGAGSGTGTSGGGGGGFGGGRGGSASATHGAGGGGGGNAGGALGATTGNHAGSPNTFQNYGGGGGGGSGVATISNQPGGSGGSNAAYPATAGGLGGPGSGAEGGGGGGGGGSGGSGSAGSTAPNAVGGPGGPGFGVNNDYGVGGAGGGYQTGAGGSGASGGGGGYIGNGGDGGILGGGGGAGGFTGGNGGFGAGGGAGRTGGVDPFGLGGAGGSGGNFSAGGGGGSGLGGAIYIQEGGALIIQDGTSFSGNSTTAGLGGTATSGINGGNGASLGQDIFIQSGGSLTFQINGTLTISTPICGAGGASSTPGVVNSGTGTVSLSGAHTYLGGTYIQAGTLNLNGSIIGDLQIESAGTLSGNATVNGSINNSGTISPGNSIGTVNTTNLILTPTSVYDVEINSSGGSDLIIASGSAQVAGGVVVIADNITFTTPLTYTIISAGSGVTGTFSSLTSTSPALLSLIYNPLTVELTYLPLDSISLTGNALSAASCYLIAPFGSDKATVHAELLALSFGDIQKAFNQMGPAQFSDITQVQLLDALLVRSTYTKHLEQLCLKKNQCCGQTISLWTDVIGQWQHQEKSHDLFGYNDTTVGGTIGADYRTHNLVLGAAISYSYDFLHWKESAGKASASTIYGGIYGRWNHDGFYINAAVLGAKNIFHTTRRLHFAEVKRQAHSDHSGTEWLTNFGVGYQGGSRRYKWTPYINLDYVVLHEDRFTEKGAKSLDLHVSAKNGTLFQGEGGVLLSGKYAAWRGFIVPTIKLAYINQTPFSSKYYHARFVHSSCGFSGKGRNFERNLFAPGLALAYERPCEMVDAAIYYDAEIGSRYWQQDVGFTLAFRF